MGNKLKVVKEKWTDEELVSLLGLGQVYSNQFRIYLEVILCDEDVYKILTCSFENLPLYINTMDIPSDIARRRLHIGK